MIFNKMDQYEKNTFDEWLDPQVKEEILRDLKERWENETQHHCVFVSATEKRNIDGLRNSIMAKVKELYQIRFPYKSEFFT